MEGQRNVHDGWAVHMLSLCTTNVNVNVDVTVNVNVNVIVIVNVNVHAPPPLYMSYLPLQTSRIKGQVSIGSSVGRGPEPKTVLIALSRRRGWQRIRCIRRERKLSECPLHWLWYGKAVSPVRFPVGLRRTPGRRPIMRHVMRAILRHRP